MGIYVCYRDFAATPQIENAKVEIAELLVISYAMH
jgi:hypothetical protein